MPIRNKGDTEVRLFGYTDVLTDSGKEKIAFKCSITDIQYATSSSRERRTVGTPTTDWEMSLTVYLRKNEDLYNLTV